MAGPPLVKVMIAEKDGVELDFNEELPFLPEKMPFSDPSFSAENVKASILEAKIAATGGGLDDEVFSSQGTVNKKFLSRQHPSKSSDEHPLVVFHDESIVGFAWENSVASPDFNVEIYKNGLAAANKIATFTITSKTSAKSDITPIALLHGDRISVFVIKNTVAPADLTFTLKSKITSETNSEVNT